MSFSIDMHYCGDTLVDSAIFHKAKTCGMSIQIDSSSTNCNIAKIDCCSDKQIVIDGQDPLKLSFDKLTFEQQIFVSSFFYINLFEGTASKEDPYFDYTPPFVKRDVQVLHQTFLI
jgi:hypothetical protein